MGDQGMQAQEEEGRDPEEQLPSLCPGQVVMEQSGMVSLMYRLDNLGGPDSWANVISGCVCGSVWEEVLI